MAEQQIIALAQVRIKGAVDYANLLSQEISTKPSCKYDSHTAAGD